MSAKRTDISTIKKYLAGELDASAMHQLEREALDDPFLMEAIEGYAEKPDQQEQLDALHRRLQQRIDQHKVRRMPARWLMAAASVFVVLGAAYLFWPFRRQSTVANQAVAVMAKTASPNPRTDTSKKPFAKEQLAATPSPAAVAKSSQQLSEAAPVPAASATAANNNTPGAVMARPIDTVPQRASVSIAKRTDSVNTATLLAADKKETPVIANVPAPAMAKARTMAAMMVPHTKVNGIVSDETGHMLSGVNVAEKGKTETVKTDSKGHFSIPANDGDILVFTSPGFKNTEVKGTVSDSLNVILPSESKSMSEMVAIDFGRPAVAPVIKEAHPQVGWDNYNQYLKNYAFLTQGKAGMVRLSFTIDAGGRLNDFKILKSLSGEADQIAVHLIKDGPAWMPDASGKAKTVTLKIVFTLREK